MKTNWDYWVVWVLVGTFSFVQLLSNVWAEAEEASAHRTARAVRITDAPPRLDGILNDDIWKTAPLHEDFRQLDPDEGEPATERTTFQIAYDDEWKNGIG